MTRTLIRRGIAVALLMAGPVVAGLPAAVAAQGIDAPTPTGRDPIPTNRLDILAASLGLSKEQKNAVKANLETAHKNAAPVRASLKAARAAIVAAVQAGKPQTDLDAAAAGYAAELTAMARLEMKALADVLGLLTPEQQNTARTNGIRTPFFLIRGVFLDDRRWNVTPPTQGY